MNNKAPLLITITNLVFQALGEIRVIISLVIRCRNIQIETQYSKAIKYILPDDGKQACRGGNVKFSSTSSNI